MVLRSALEGIGDIRYSSMIGITTLGVRIASSFLMRSGFANRTVALAEGVSWCFLLLMMGARVIYRRREIGLKEQKIH